MELPALFFPGRLGMEIQRGKGNRDMKIVIVGDGKVGITLTQQLAREGHDIVIIDKDLKVLRETVDHYDVMGIHGNGASLTVQREAGVGESDLLIGRHVGRRGQYFVLYFGPPAGGETHHCPVRDPGVQRPAVFPQRGSGALHDD